MVVHVELDGRVDVGDEERKTRVRRLVVLLLASGANGSKVRTTVCPVDGADGGGRA